MFPIRPPHPYAFLLLTLPGLPLVAAPAEAAPTVTAATAAVPDGTEVHFTLMKDIKSGGSKAGEDVPFEVSQDVYSPARVLLISANTPAYGKILQSNRRGMFGQPGKLKFSIDYILAPDKTHILLRADPQLLRGSDNRTASVATAVLLAPIAILINGKDVSVKKGEAFTMYVSAPVAPPAPVSPAPLSRTTVSVPAAAPSTPAFQSLITFANGAQTTGTLLTFDGSTYTVSTPKGTRQFKVAAIKSIHALSPAFDHTAAVKR